MNWLLRLCVIFIFCTLGCTKQPEIPKNHILAKVGSFTITIQDFIRRAEYAIRPSYCRQSNYVHKKIILNSLIGEKLTALEFETGPNLNPTNNDLELFLQGRKEQAMRQVHYANEFYSTVEIQEGALKKAYDIAGRRISVQYLNLPDLKIVEKIRNLTEEGIPLDSIHNSLWGGSAPAREISWFDRGQNDVHKVLFNRGIKKGQLLGPFTTEDSTYVIMAVKGWVDQPVITESDQNQRWGDVKERLTEKKAKEKYFGWVENLMRGKEMKLNPVIFYKYSNRAADYFFKMDSVKQNALNQAIWDEPAILDQSTIIVDHRDLELDPNSILLKYNGKDWTVKDFNEKLKTHPFVFRKRKMNRSEFPEQLRFAIADFFRDIEITKKCYEQGYDKYWSVDTHVDMWRGATLSRKFTSYLRINNNHITNQDQWLDFMNPIMDSLQKKYSDQIEINMNAFESIELTSTDMVVTQRGVPFVKVVPSFPIITTDSRIDYGSKSKLDD
ncbi:MAG: hypothetical protein HOK52_00170 [Candidatus Marinimicrobia bacterium]|jgi:hypothetical protein|nr:hypothetical protein [Candidatus Neomarinimicrobiota bacterium]MBT3936908.1 hypothetical protein [Candidatus Neomarinimicrobiota bacterium]MBT3962169.1 hypothetical protein [Candidatus Neomarinimicrobiota bacterium]MBT4383313.1 hypothetical protein [Candidatus Neomarinimicrobiota bacterium]MBT4635533.1 hypothetical protein [Candidatus Neomarinimicrobiota bacterium]